MISNRRFILRIALVVLFVRDGSSVQTPQRTPIQMPQQFELYLEEGRGDPATNAVESGRYDAYDSAKKQRLYDANGGQVRYQAELTDSERKMVYEAVLQNNLLALRNDFTLVNSRVSPNMIGRLRLNIDGIIKEIKYSPYYHLENPNDSGWIRLRNVLDVIEGILKTKDAKQNLPRHNGYE
jgi:hypothetical protein